MPSKRDKTTGLPLPDPVVPATNLCVQMIIPNDPLYVQAFKGVLADLGKWWNWAHTVGEGNEPALTAAEMWRDRLQYVLISEDCEDPMNCASVTNCIQTNPATKGAIQQMITTVSTPGVTSTPGVPMSAAAAAAPLNILEGCDPDQLWAQSEQLVDYVIQAGIDMLEKIEAYTNSVEAVQFVEMIPILGTLFDEAQLDKVVDFIDWVIEVATEIFLAADTPEARELIKCAIFCAAKDDCVISIDRLWAVENERLGGALNPSEITTPEQLIETLVALGTNPALPLDVWFTFTIAMAKLAGYLGVRGIDYTLTLLLKLAVNDANNDWELLCVDCATPPPLGCEDPDKFVIGNVTSQSGKEFTVAGTYQPLTGYWRIEWGKIDCSEDPCYGFDWEFLSGALNTAEIIGEGCVNISLAALPQDVYFFYFAAPSPFTMKITFLDP